MFVYRLLQCEIETEMAMRCEPCMGDSSFSDHRGTLVPAMREIPPWPHVCIENRRHAKRSREAGRLVLVEELFECPSEAPLALCQGP
jgi:hypothetical protein